MNNYFDLFVIGGGVNGCGIARDAVGRNLSVALCEQNDLAQGTSSASTKLIHGGLRYLEHFEFKLVRESLIEREVLLNSMPHISWPLRFTLPHHSGLRPAWLLRLGLFLYDHLGGRKQLPATKTIKLRKHASGLPLKKDFSLGFEYSDCWVEDSRLVVLTAKDAMTRGARILTRTTFISGVRKNNYWLIKVKDNRDDSIHIFHSKALVNCSGPWIKNVLAKGIKKNTTSAIRLVRGSHIVTKKLFPESNNYIFQNSDGRIIFAIPYENDFTLIGTTDIDHKEDIDKAICSDEEKVYLTKSASEYFKNSIGLNDIVWTFSGIRPLFDDNSSSAQKATRDYRIETTAINGSLPLTNVFGGKITTYRKLAEAVMVELKPFFNSLGPSWTKESTLPGGDFLISELPSLIIQLQKTFPFLDKKWAKRLIRAYGTDAFSVLKGCSKKTHLGKVFGWNLTEKEVRWLMENEWAETAEDILWRRSKVGLRLSMNEINELSSWISSVKNS